MNVYMFEKVCFSLRNATSNYGQCWIEHSFFLNFAKNDSFKVFL